MNFNRDFFSKLNPILKNEALQKMLSHCPVCNYQYKLLQAKIITENDDANLISIQCQNCSSNLLILILLSGPLISSMILITDLTPEDVIKFNKQNVIIEEDLLELHQALKMKNFCHNFNNN